MLMSGYNNHTEIFECSFISMFDLIQSTWLPAMLESRPSLVRGDTFIPVCAYFFFLILPLFNCSTSPFSSPLFCLVWEEVKQNVILWIPIQILDPPTFFAPFFLVEAWLSYQVVSNGSVPKKALLHHVGCSARLSLNIFDADIQGMKILPSFSCT